MYHVISQSPVKGTQYIEVTVEFTENDERKVRSGRIYFTSNPNARKHIKAQMDAIGAPLTMSEDELNTILSDGEGLTGNKVRVSVETVEHNDNLYDNITYFSKSRIVDCSEEARKLTSWIKEKVAPTEVYASTEEEPF
jgi:hypothetical protein